MNNYIDINENLTWKKEIESNWKDFMEFFIIDNSFVSTSEMAFYLNTLYSEDFIINSEYGTILSSPIKGNRRKSIQMAYYEYFVKIITVIKNKKLLDDSNKLFQIVVELFYQ